MVKAMQASMRLLLITVEQTPRIWLIFMQVFAMQILVNGKKHSRRLTLIRLRVTQW